VGSTFYYVTFLSQLVPVFLGLGEEGNAERILREAADFATKTADAQHSLEVVWGGAQLWIHRAEREDLMTEQQSAWAVMGARWAGAALSSPNLAPNNRDVLRRLIPNLHAALGAERTTKLLTAGAQLAPDSLIAELGAAFFGQ